MEHMKFAIKKISAAILIALLACAGCPAPAARAADLPAGDGAGPVLGFDLELRAEAAYFVSLDTDEVIYQKNADKRMMPASTTKIMTAALVMEICDDLDGTAVTVPQGVWNEFGDMQGLSNAGLKAGEELTMNQLLHCLLLQSANEAAVAIAEYYGGQAFIGMMNDKARELGCGDTLFSTAHGAFTENHYTTARDLATITRWALGVPGFWEITQKARYYKEETNKNEGVTLVSTIEMQDTASRYYTPYVKGIKSGTLDEAGRCLVTAAQKGGVSYMLVLLGAPYENDDRVWSDGTSVYADTRLCYDWAFENLELANIVDGLSAVADIKIRHAAGKDNLLLYPAGGLFTLVRADADGEEEITYDFSGLPEEVNAPIEVGDVLGSAKVYYGGKYAGEVDLISWEKVELDAFVLVMDSISDILTSTAAKIIYVVLLLVAIAYLYYVFVAVPIARKKQRRRRAAARRRGRK
jgi:D-alanyl-D-alanine carboxypeptidase (penicillin-binding protein 5/6)